MLHLSLAAFVAALTFVTGAAGAAASSVQPERRFPPSRYPLPAPPIEEWKIGDEAAAIGAAREVLRGLLNDPGVDGARAAAERAELLEMEDDRGPCVGRGVRLWRVAMHPVCLRGGEGEALARRAVCYFHPIDRSLRRVEIIHDGAAVEAPPEPGSRAYQLQLMGAGPERWVLTKFPDTPRVSLAEALESVDKERGGVGSAKLIAVHLISWSYGPAGQRADGEGGVGDLEFKDVWSIDLRGLPPSRTAGEGVPGEARGHVRHIVDATTGRWVMALTTPEPEQSPSAPPALAPAPDDPAPEGR